MIQLTTTTLSQIASDLEESAGESACSSQSFPDPLAWTVSLTLNLLRSITHFGRRKTLLLVALLPAGVAMGYLFYLGCAAGFFVSKACGGAEEGIQGRVRSIIIPLRSHEIHLHHWLISVVATVASAVHGFFLIAPGLFYGILGGLILQGILCYNDWHRILKRRDFLSVFDEPDSLGA